MQMDVENSLCRINAGICNEAITALINSFLFGEFACCCDEMSHQLLILYFERIDRLDVPVRYDQYMSWRDRVDIAESGQLFVPINDGRFRFVRNDLAENARVCHIGFDP